MTALRDDSGGGGFAMVDSKDDERRDEILRRMLSMPPKPHKESKVNKPARKPKAAKGKA
jgi:hypothetical protein